MKRGGNDVRASLSIPHFFDNFDTASGKVSNPEIDSQLRSALATLADPTNSNDLEENS